MNSATPPNHIDAATYRQVLTNLNMEYARTHDPAVENQITQVAAIFRNGCTIKWGKHSFFTQMFQFEVDHNQTLTTTQKRYLDQCAHRGEMNIEELRGRGIDVEFSNV